MSLKVWLPLNGDLRNNGIYNLPSPVINTLTYVDGKIGKCGQGRLSWHLSEDILDNEWTVAMWFNSPVNFGSYNNVLFCKNISQSSDCQIYFSIINNKTLNIGVNGSVSSLSYSFSFSIDTWYHVAAAYDGTKVTLYLNGSAVKSGTVTAAKPEGRLNMMIDGRSANEAGTSQTGGIGMKYNDVRIYDHCLSAAEVREIAQGLIMHYKLNNNILSGVIQDSSGYGHNAVLQEGTLLSTADTARYNSSIISEETTCCKIQDTIFNSQHLASEFTWAGWIKRNYTATEAKYVYKGIAYIYLADDFGIRIGWRHRNEDGSYDINNAWAPGKIIPYNEWTHVAFTFKDGVMKVYINGEYSRTSDRSETGIYMRGYRNFYFPSEAGDSFIGNISDMRVYCTALLDKDIKLLYNVSSRIDNLGEVHSFELEEKDNNLLAGTLITSAYTNKVNPYTKYNSNGEMYFDTNSTSAGSNYISINPTNHTYYYDFDISVNAGNQFYIGFERYDANKTSRSNRATIYVYSTKSTEDINHKHIFGTVDLSTDGVNPCAFVALRILNGWSGTDSGVVGVATIHSMSLREISNIQNPKSCKNGILSTGEFKEYQKASFYKNGFVEATEFIEN